MKSIYTYTKTVLIATTLWVVAGNAQEWGNVMQLGNFKQKNETTRQTYDRVIAENSRVAVKFYMTHCRPCETLAPEFIAQAQQHKNILFLELNANEHDSLSDQLGIRSAPTVILYKNNKQVARWTGGDKQRLRSEIAQLLQ